MKFENMIGKIIKGDCRNILKDIPNGAVDLILTDPPFGKCCYRGLNQIGKLKEKNRTYESMARWGIEEKPTIKEMRWICKKAKNYIVWGGNYFFEAFPSRNCFLIWDKGEWGETCFADVELAATSFNTVARRYICRNRGFVKDSKDGKIDHPTPKPSELFKWCIQKYTKPGDLVLDPYMGSGTTAVACIELGRRFIGIERESKYVKLARERIKALEMKPQLPGMAQ